MAISAHQDDIEMMAVQPILECFHRSDSWFTGVVMTDGRGSPRAGRYGAYTDDEMRLARLDEQRKAALLGHYSALVMLDYPSAIVKEPASQGPVDDLVDLLEVARPGVVYTHNLADKHDTHVSVALRVITAIRTLPVADRPKQLFGCEVWRSLDWLLDTDKVKMDLSERENLQAALLGIFDSQISGGKRYDLGTMGRRRANATFSEFYTVDTVTSLAYAMDMSPLIFDESIDPMDFVRHLIDRFAQDVTDRLLRLT
jgi:LmbE family N-acetylglucosaminyl deacetylase